MFPSHEAFRENRNDINFFCSILLHAVLSYISEGDSRSPNAQTEAESFGYGSAHGELEFDKGRNLCR